MTAATNLRNFPPVEQPVEAPATLSQTKLSRFEKCRRAAYLELLHGGGKQTIEMARGIVLHDALEQLQNYMLANGEVTVPGEVAKDWAEAVMKERLDLPLTAEEMDRIRLMAWQWAESPFGKIDPSITFGIEVPLELESNGWRLTCRIDKLETGNGTAWIYDWKSGFPTGSRDDVRRSFQAQFYGAALLFGHKPDAPELQLGAGINDIFFYEVFPRVKDSDGHLICREAVFSRSELHEFRTALDRNVAAYERCLETGEWPATDGSWCERCPAPSECPIPEHLRDVPPIGSVADAEDAFSLKLVNEREGRRIQTGLREWSKENGPIYVGDYCFGPTVVESKSVKDWPGLEDAISRAVNLGEPFDPEPYIERRQSTKFAKRKQTPEELEARE